MSAGTRHPAIETMLQKDGVWAIADTNAPGKIVIAVCHGGVITAMSPDNDLHPDRFLDTATFTPLDFTGEATALIRAENDYYAKRISMIIDALLDEGSDEAAIDAAVKKGGIEAIAQRVKLTAELSNLAQMRHGKALQFYANEANYRTTSSGYAYDHESTAINTDKGQKARDALAWKDEIAADQATATKAPA